MKTNQDSHPSLTRRVRVILSRDENTMGANMIALEEHAEGVVVPVKAQPGARRTGLAGVHAGALKVQVTQAPEKGKATDAVLATIAAALKLKRSQLSLLSGATSPQKRVLVTGLSSAEVAERLQAELRTAEK